MDSRQSGSIIAGDMLLLRETLVGFRYINREDTSVMVWSILFLLAVIGLVASETIYIPAEIGSDLHFPVPKLAEFWDIYAGDRRIGNYHGGLMALNGYYRRLRFDSETNVVTLQKWSKADGLNFRVAVKQRNENDKLTSHDVDYKILLEEPATNMVRKTTENVFSSSRCLTVSIIPFLLFVFSAVVIGNVCF